MGVLNFFALANTQARMNLKAESSRFILSYLWWIIEPLLFVLVFYLVFEVLLSRGREDFLIFLICGKIPFLWFQKSVTAASSSIVQNRGLIHQLEVPKALFPYAAVLEAFYKQWVVFLVMFVVVVFYVGWPGLHWLWLIPLMVVQFGLILLCSLVGAFCVSFVWDLMMVINLGMMFLLFTSGVFWDINAILNPEIRDLVMICNPISFILDAYRQVLMYKSVYSLNHLAALALVVSSGLLLMHYLLRKTSKIIAEKVLNS